jgi:EAL domain-containing protein (putative c-di-GMP-specific phosphodiesterase class I)
MPSVRQALAESGLRPSRLELEVTETVLLMQGGDLDVFAALHELGIRIAIDDFGAGYSSLSYLRGFAFESIRIDRSFVHDLPDDAPSRAIVGAVMALAHGLGMRATAEGVATEDQLAELRRQGCNVVQGPLFGEPMPAAEAQRRIVGPAAPRRVADLDAVGSPA